mmetsp:Transcript_28280/g.61197  ORF Transcript_28280/g.61197 Transcript_28280/m.61197 type:complete len:205 (+) Transcript_28280:45-659(+)
MGGTHDERGIPLKSDYDKFPMPITLMYPLFTGVFIAIGFGVSTVILSTQQTEDRLRLIKEFNLGWIYLGVLVLKLGQLVTGINLGQARKASKVNLPDQQAYKVHGTEKYALMDNEGAIGRFNRAQRSLQNYNEVLPMFLIEFALAGFVIPFPVFCITAFWAATRALSAFGYTASVQGRMSGNMLAGLAMSTLEGTLLKVGLATI